MEKLVLAYSGGLDTSVILKWLLDKGYDVIAYLADVGQNEDFEKAKAKALKIGASKVHVVDAREEFVTDFIFPAIRGSALYEGRYLLGTSLARPVIAKHQIDIAKKEGATAVGHGATGKGNDQVRFELTCYALKPDVKIVAPWKDEEFLNQFQGRTDLLAFAEKSGIPVEATTKAPYSTDGNLMHISYEAGILEDPAMRPPAEIFKLTKSPQEAPDKTTRLAITFKNGTPTKVENLEDGHTETNPLSMLIYLNKIGGENGVGRIDIVENRYVGIKSRGVYETPGGTILWKAHQDLETISMDREVFRLKEMLVPRFAELIYYGYWYSPEMEWIRYSLDKAQEVVNGVVYVDLYKGNITIAGRKAENSLYDQKLSSMDIAGGYDQRDAAGFIRINAVRLKVNSVDRGWTKGFDTYGKTLG